MLVPVEIEGLSHERVKELLPFTCRSVDEMRKLLRAQIAMIKHFLDLQATALGREIYNAMDF